MIPVGVLAGQEAAAAPVPGTVTWRTTGATAGSADTASPFANITYTLPTGHTTNDILVLFYGGKPYSTTTGTPTDYTPAGSVADGTTANAVGVGSLRAQAFWKVHDGSEANPSGTMSAGYSPAMRATMAASCSVSGGGWSVEYTTGVDSDASGSTVSVTGGSLDWAVGDQILFVSAGPGIFSETSPALSFSGGVEAGTLTEHLPSHSTSQGNDGALYVYKATITTAGTGAPTFTCTSSGASNRAVIFLKITPPTA